VLSKSDEEEKARDTPLADGELLDGACSVALCIDAAAGGFGFS
jgi:hypothetical protein